MSLFRALRSTLVEAPPTRETERGELLLPEGGVVPLVQVRDRRSRRLRLTVSERGVRLSVPWRVSDRVAAAFVQDHLPWIAEHWARVRDRTPAVDWDAGLPATLPLWGEERPVEALPGRAVRVTPGGADDGPWTIHRPSRAGGVAVRRALHEAYAAEARAAVGRMLPRYLGGLPRPPRAFRFRALSSLWGSLAPDGTVSMDLSLVLGPPAAFEYVLVHELCHLLRADHSPAFWAEVEARWPAWREQRRFLRSPEGLCLKARWRAIVATR